MNEEEIIEVPLSFDTPEFAQAWTLYKEDMIESYRIYLSPREENIMLDWLNIWSNNNSEKAIEILEYIIVNGWTYRESNRYLLKNNGII
ncbi:MAG: hypothetical protein LBQ74_14695 [Prevotella sp.]|jgi:hypothetical protein|nr:hypothetical protein [Prevotella sp.]